MKYDCYYFQPKYPKDIKREFTSEKPHCNKCQDEDELGACCCVHACEYIDMTPKAKSPEELCEEWMSFEDTDVLKDTDWLKSSMASLLLWAAEEAKPAEWYDDQGDYDTALGDYQKALITLANNITKI